MGAEQSQAPAPAVASTDDSGRPIMSLPIRERMRLLAKKKE